MALRIAVDAWNLVDDHRGMGRYVRRILADWEDQPDLEITLVAKTRAHRAILAEAFPYRCEVGVPRGVDAVWYPWNAMRFSARGARSVVTVYDAFAFTFAHPEFVARWREQSPIRKAVRNADRRATISHWSASELGRVFTLDPSVFTVIPPVPDPFWSPVPSERSEPYVLVVGGPDARKNLVTLFSAFSGLNTRTISLTVAGRLSSADEALLAQSSFRYERVHPTDAELRRLYNGALAVTVPSTAEGYGLMCVEAMACGAAVIASDSSAMPEACNGAAVLVAPTDTGAWTETLQRIISDEAYRNDLRARSLARVATIDRGAPARATLALLRDR